MNINIAGNLKRLRKQREITQEDLAGFLSVSFQAVSKWERGEGLPDITILPAIANFFDVTLDELVGMNEIKNSAKLEEIKEQLRQLTSDGKIKEAIALLREALQIFPNDYFLLAELACYLDYHGETDEERQKNYDEAIKISERIIEFCPDPVIRNNVQSNMCFALWGKGDKAKAIETAEKLPNLYKTREFTLNKFLKRDKKIEECQKAIQELAWGFYWQACLLAEQWQHPLVDEHEHYTAEQAIKINQKAIDFYKIVYEDGDFLFSHCRLQQLYESIAQIYINIGKTEESIINLEKSAEHAIAYSSLPEKQKYTSLLVNMLTHEKAGTSTSTEKNYAYILKNRIETDEVYTSILNDGRVRKILDELGKYAN
jgi:transcriptional regulator with XRE-family HTH domain